MESPVVPSGLTLRDAFMFHGLTPMATTYRHFVATHARHFVAVGESRRDGTM